MNRRTVCIIGGCEWSDMLSSALRDSGFETKRCQDVADASLDADVVCLAIDFETSTRRCAETVFEVAKLASGRTIWLVVRRSESEAVLIALHRGEVLPVRADHFEQALSRIIEANSCQVPELDNVLEITTIRQRRDSLTRREREVMELVVRGWLNKQIASELDLSPKTIEVHRASVMHKMQCDSLAGLVRCAVALEYADADTHGHALDRALV